MVWGDVKVVERIADLDERWDELVASVRAPVFYRRPFLTAFEAFPLHSIEATRYVTVEGSGGRLGAGLPVYLVRDVDPMRVLADHYPSAVGEPLLLSHVWHCYDTQLPTRGGPELTAVALQAMRKVAVDCGASWWGVANVNAADRAVPLLEEAGLHGADINVGWRRRLTDIEGFDQYMAGLKRDHRYHLRRDLRNATKAQSHVSMLSAQEADLDEFVALARMTATKFDNADYYHPDRFPRFLRQLGNDARLMELRVEDRLVGAVVVLLDEDRLHFWCCGADYDSCHGFSPFYVLFARLLQVSLQEGKVWFEFGRNNPVFKRRYAMTPHALRAFLAPVN
jgi:predicted N-acyltransferase